MNHRERVVPALDYEQTDRVPIDLGSTIVTTVTHTAYQSLLEHRYQAALEQGAVAA